ncbi:hypothetical protein [Winogradskyella sp. SYSU M77433]|uniref:hypothetical protein n=1 Tax=Winogradskyella sp. SYSU M77433 TaxID=3042722 RepID=UPI00248057A2|nr:hypothetical protein [Winogradskyella sp. SYSU M77433]MDH7911775.1 hypothetical protein [Winogradskyella sp. SYSU M77433]
MKTNSILTIILLLAFHLNAQTINQEIIEEGEAPYLLGQIDKSGLESDNYSSWFNTNFEDYKPNQKLVNDIASDLKNYNITVFMGTWCGDSKKEVPRLYKVLEACNFPMDQLTVIAVSSSSSLYKQSPQHEEAGLNIHRVPTIIFYKNGKEVNRIVEHPVTSFEKDIKQIISSNNYKPNYQIVSEIDAVLNKKGIKGLEKKSEKILKQFDGKVTSMYELNTYGRVLYSKGKIEEAIAVFKFNTKLFPKEPGTYMSLANTLGVNGKKDEAIKVLEKALEIHPENEDLKENLEVIKSH